MQAKTPDPPAATTEAAATQPERRSMARSAGIVGLAVMGSRVLGLVREQIFAAYFGDRFAADAFIIAFRIPNLLRDLLAEGALSAAFVTTFSQTLKQKGEKEAWQLANYVNNGLVLVLTVIALAGILLAPQIVGLLMAPPDFLSVLGITARNPLAPAKLQLTIELATKMTRIMFPFLMMVSLAAVAMGILNTKNRFGVPASASTLFNVGSIFGGLFCSYLLAPEYIAGVTNAILHGQKPPVDDTGVARAIVGMAIGTLIGGVFQWLIQVPSLRAVGYRWRPILNFRDEGMRQVMRLMAPAIIGVAAVQVNVLVNTTFAASLGEGRQAWLNYAFRLILFPIGVFGVAISTATLPIASRAALENMDEFRRTIVSALRLVFLLNIPSTIGLMVLSEPIIALIYQRGSFTASATAQTAAALQFYALGLTTYSAIKVLAPAFYALKETRIPMITSLASIVTNYIVASLTMNRLEHRGLALSISAVSIVNFSLLFLFMRRKIGGLDERGLLESLAKVTIASLVMGAVCWLLSRQIIAFAGNDSFSGRLLNVTVSIAVGATIFFVIARILRVGELDQMMAVARRKLGRKR
ncbi:MAG: murein biosynthesis integral membrane protein MurJ [Blastocatellia bacterium]